MPITPGESTNVAIGSRTNTTVTTPAGSVVGDVLTVSMTAGIASLTPVTITAPGGWELMGETFYQAADPYTVRLAMYARVHDGSTTYTFTHPTASSQAFCQRWLGVSTTTIQDVAAQTAFVHGASTSSFTIDAPSLTTVTPDALSIVHRGSWDGQAITAPAGLIEVHDSVVQWVGYRANLAAGATGTTAVSTGNNQATGPRGIIHGALRPAPAVAQDEGTKNTSAARSMAAFARGGL